MRVSTHMNKALESVIIKDLKLKNAFLLSNCWCIIPAVLINYSSMLTNLLISVDICSVQR